MHVLRLTSVFETPAESLEGPGARFDPVGGMQVHTAQLTRALDRLGVRQMVITAWRPNAPAREPIGEWATLLRVGLPVPRLRQLYGLLAPSVALRESAGADLVHAHVGADVSALWVARIVASVRRIPLVLTIHSSARHTMSETRSGARLLHALAARLEDRAERSADAVLVLTQRLARLLTAAGVDPARIHRIPLGIDPGRFRTVPRDPAPAAVRRVLFVGRLVLSKGVDTLLRAAVMLPEGTEVVIVGDGPERTRLERLCAALRLRHRVRFVGFVPNVVIHGELARADVVVLPSRAEELGRVLIEAMQSGVPVVATRVGGIADVVTDLESGLLVAPDRPAELASAIRRVLVDPDLAGRLRRGGRRVAAQHDLPAQAHAVLRVYEHIRELHRPPAPELGSPFTTA